MSDLHKVIDSVIEALDERDWNGTKLALHAFAAAIQREKGRCCDNGLFGDAHVCQKQPGAPQMTTEEAAKIMLGHIPKCPKCAVSYPSDLHLEKCSWKQPTPELPKEVRKELDEIQCEIWKATGWSLDKVLTTFSRIENLCLSMRAK